VYLGIAKTDAGSMRLSWDNIQDCHRDMCVLDASVGVFAIPSMGAIFTGLTV